MLFISRKELRFSFKIVFFLIQIITILSGVILSLTSFAFYFSLFNIFPLHLPFYNILFIKILLSILKISSGIFGFRVLYNIRSNRSNEGNRSNRRNGSNESNQGNESKFRLCIYIFSIIILYNLQLIEILNINKMVTKNKEISNNLWNSLNKVQRRLVEFKFDCCGYNLDTKHTTDIKSNSNSNTNIPCSVIFTNIAKRLKQWVQKFFVGMFIIESIGICIISYLKLLK